MLDPVPWKLFPRHSQEKDSRRRIRVKAVGFSAPVQDHEFEGASAGCGENVACAVNIHGVRTKVVYVDDCAACIDPRNGS